MPLRVRWLGRVRYEDASALQRALRRSSEDYLLLLEHPHVYTLGVRTRPEHLLEGVAASGASVVRADRGGDVTYHGPGQLVGYPIVGVPTEHGAVPAHVRRIEQLVIDALAAVGLPGAGRLEGYPGVWVGADGPRPRKICAIGVRVDRGRSMHGFALNVSCDLGMFANIVPCGIADKAVTSLAAEGVSASMQEVVEAVSSLAPSAFGHPGASERQDATGPAPASAGRPAAGVGSEAPGGAGTAGRSAPGEVLALGALGRRLGAAGVDTSEAVSWRERKPPYIRAPFSLGTPALRLRSLVRELGLVTVCEEAGCPNLSECWTDGTATFMINGERCTRACGFCLVDTRHPLAVDPEEPERVAEAVRRLGLAHAVITAVARDDMADGGAAGFAATVEAIRRLSPSTAVEVLIPDCKGEESSLAAIFDARPDVLNHNLETVLRLQRAVRPSASYARSLSVLARAKSSGLTTKSGMILGLGESEEEVRGAMVDLRSAGVDLLTLGQYLRPSARHLPVMRWWRPEEFDALAEHGRTLGFAHVEASPLTRSSYHARQAAARAGGDASLARSVASTG